MKRNLMVSITIVIVVLITLSVGVMKFNLIANHNSSPVTINLPVLDQREYKMLVLEIKQKHYNLSISDHLKDKMNAVTFEIPVDSVYFDIVNVGDVIVSEVRGGSLVTSGSLGELQVTVVDKYTK